MNHRTLTLTLALAAALPLGAAAGEQGRYAEPGGGGFFAMPAMQAAQLSPEERARLRERWRETPVEERERLRREFGERERRRDEGHGYGQGFEQRQWEREPPGGMQGPGGRSGGGHGPSRGGGRR